MRSFVFIGLLALSSVSWAQLLDGNELLSMCRGPDKTFAAGNCEGFIAGVSDTIIFSRNQRDTSRRICLPKRLQQAQIKRIVVDYLVLVPQLRDNDATFLVEIALRTAYPC